LPRDARTAQRGNDLGKEIRGYALMTEDRRMYRIPTVAAALSII
jgi:hypothetical protein